MLGMLQCDEEVEEAEGGEGGAPPKPKKTRWLYNLGSDVDVETLCSMGQMPPPPEVPF